MVTALHAAEPPAISSGTSLVKPDSFVLAGDQRQLGTFEQIQVTRQRFATAMQVVTTRAPVTEWNIQLKTSNSAAIKAGDVMLAHFWIRGAESMTGESFTSFEAELGPPEYEKLAELRLGATHQWRECFVPFKSATDISAGAASFCFRCGFDHQTIEIGGVEIVNFGPHVRLEDLPRTRDTYPGREIDAVWRKAALERIDKIRKGDFTIHVVDAGGNPIPDAEIHVQQKRHAFRFGSCVTADLLLGQSADARKYQETFASLFNQATFENEMKWPVVVDGVPPRVDRAVQWLLDRKIQIRGHNLIWPGKRWLPDSILAMGGNAAALRAAAEAHIKNEVSHFRGKVIQWDVVNEPYSNRYLTDILGREVMIDWYKLARANDPNCKLFLNDFGIVDGGGLDIKHQQSFYDTLDYLKSSGAPLDGIGIQSHFGAILTDPARVLQIFDRFSKLGLPIESTEVSINCGDRDLQSDYLRDYLTAAFSHPNVQGIMLWGFWEKRHWRPESALFSANWEPRPLGKMWIDLVQKQWWTDVTVRSDHAGQAMLRGFLGEYEITATTPKTTGTTTTRLDSTGSTVTLTIK